VIAYALGISVSTVGVHLARVRQKLRTIHKSLPRDTD
jgi:DNA-binding CsgD family transcriptional regulator